MAEFWVEWTGGWINYYANEWTIECGNEPRNEWMNIILTVLKSRTCFSTVLQRMNDWTNCMICVKSKYLSKLEKGLSDSGEEPNWWVDQGVMLDSGEDALSARKHQFNKYPSKYVRYFHVEEMRQFPPKEAYCFLRIHNSSRTLHKQIPNLMRILNFSHNNPSYFWSHKTFKFLKEHFLFRFLISWDI
jgi:hypothetical protein